MKKTLLTTCLLLLSLMASSQQVISDKSLSSQRWRSTSNHSSLIYTPGAQQVQSASEGMSYSSNPQAYSLPSVSPKSGQMASEIYAPFSSNVNSVSRRREVMWGIDDPGPRDTESPVGDAWVMLLFAAIMALCISKRKSIKHT